MANALPQAIGLRGVRITGAGEVAAGVRVVLAHPGPALPDVVTARTELSIPRRITLEQMKGFTPYMAQAIPSGRGDAVVELGKTNAGPLKRLFWEHASGHRSTILAGKVISVAYGGGTSDGQDITS